MSMKGEYKLWPRPSTYPSIGSQYGCQSFLGPLTQLTEILFRVLAPPDPQCKPEVAGVLACLKGIRKKRGMCVQLLPEISVRLCFLVSRWVGQ